MKEAVALERQVLKWASALVDWVLLKSLNS
jgi:hypothetical protein